MADVPVRGAGVAGLVVTHERLKREASMSISAIFGKSDRSGRLLDCTLSRSYRRDCWAEADGAALYSAERRNQWRLCSR